MCETFQLFFCPELFLKFSKFIFRYSVEKRTNPQYLAIFYIIYIYLLQVFTDNITALMESIEINTLKNNSSFQSDLYVDESFLFLPKSADLTESMIKLLKDWGFTSLLSEEKTVQPAMTLEEATGRKPSKPEVSVEAEETQEDSAPKNRVSDNLKKVLANSKASASENSDQTRMEIIRDIYEEYLNYIESVFTHYATHKEIDQEELSESVQELCVIIKEHRRYILRYNQTVETGNKNFIVIHAMRTTVIAIAIALQLKLPLSKMIDLGITSILHEIGMLRLPPQLYMSTKKLTAGERAQITKHTVLGYSIVKDLEFPLTVQLGVLEHHENENGTGYPRKLSSDKISSNAKIISVACTYEAITSSRSYKDERSSFEAIIELISNKERKYDDAVVKALLFTVSLYPIGSYVYLSNRKVAIVVDANPSNPKSPIVQLVTETNPDGSSKIIPTDSQTYILRILTKEERNDILKIVEEKYQHIEEAHQAMEEAQKSTPEENKESVVHSQTEIAAASKTLDDGTEEIDISFFN